MSEAHEEQTGYVRPRFPAAATANNLPYDVVWADAVQEYQRLKEAGMPRRVASAVFTPLLNDPERRDAARLMLDSAAVAG